MDFALAYFLSCFITCMGVLQVASVSSRTKYLRLFGPPLLRKTLGIGLIIIALPLFFLTGDRVLSDHEGGLDANQQAGIFTFAALISYLLTAIISQFVWKSKINSSVLEPFRSRIYEYDSGELTFIKLQEKNWTDFKHLIIGRFNS